MGALQGRGCILPGKAVVRWKRAKDCRDACFWGKDNGWAAKPKRKWRGSCGGEGRWGKEELGPLPRIAACRFFGGKIDHWAPVDKMIGKGIKYAAADKRTDQN